MRHAYLIIAHHQPELLKVLLSLIDDERNDIFVHLDQRASGIGEDELAAVVQRSRIHFTDRTRVSWGGYSMINAELLLLRAAQAAETYDYLHLLSGVDLPLKTQDEVHAFFDRHRGQEFIHFENKPEIDYRIKYFYPWQELKGRNPDGRPEYLRNLSVAAQHIAGVNRIKQYGLDLRFGSQWFSITSDLAAFLVSGAQRIHDIYKMSLCCDEIFLQTTVASSPFASAVFRSGSSRDHLGCMRYVDWTRGDPYTFTMADYQSLIDSPYLFARKFHTDVDREVVLRLQAFLGGSVR